jgi:hypothetical protein
MKLGKSTTKARDMLRKAFGEHSLSRIKVSEWRSRFKPSRVSVEDDQCSGEQCTTVK